MTSDELFNFLLRFAAALVWVARTWQLIRYHERAPDHSRRVITAGALAALLVTISLGGLVSALDLVEGEVIRFAYTAVAVGVLIAGVVVWKR